MILEAYCYLICIYLCFPPPPELFDKFSVSPEASIVPASLFKIFVVLVPATIELFLVDPKLIPLNYLTDSSKIAYVSSNSCLSFLNP